MTARTVRRAILVVSSIVLLAPVVRAQNTTTAFVHYNVIPMTRDTVLRDHTVLVADGKITAVGPSTTTRVPRGATQLDGKGTQYLLPALADMHTHARRPGELSLYAANGVLTILNLGNSPDVFVRLERLRYNSGEAFGPTIFESLRLNQPWGGSYGITTVAEARNAVRGAKQTGYDFIKVYSFLSDSVYETIMQEAAAAGMTVVGHHTYNVGLRRGFQLGLKMVAHAEELRPNFGMVVSAARADSLVQLFKEFGTWLTPTLSTFEAITNTWANPTRLEDYVQEGLVAHVPVGTAEAWRRTNYHTQRGSVAEHNASYIDATRKLYHAGVPMLAGTDGPGIPGMIPGLSLLRELEILQSIGMTSYEALETATSNPGRFIATYVPGATPFGAIAVGTRADLLIVSGNPLANLDALRNLTAVVRLGRVYSAAQLDSVRRTN
jgi:imidazolonepropionase-like amidohydrolase